MAEAQVVTSPCHYDATTRFHKSSDSECQLNLRNGKYSGLLSFLDSEPSLGHISHSTPAKPPPSRQITKMQGTFEFSQRHEIKLHLPRSRGIWSAKDGYVCVWFIQSPLLMHRRPGPKESPPCKRCTFTKVRFQRKRRTLFGYATYELCCSAYYSKQPGERHRLSFLRGQPVDHFRWDSPWCGLSFLLIGLVLQSFGELASK